MRIDKIVLNNFGSYEGETIFDTSTENGRNIILVGGKNGAGKTTLFNLLTGVYEPTTGKVILNTHGKEREIQGKKPYNICGEGVARTFQNIRLFKELSVLDNVRIAMHQRVGYTMFPDAFLHTPKYVREEERMIKEAVARGRNREEEILRQANEEAAAILNKASADIAQEKKKAINDAKDEISDMAMAIAGKVVGRVLDEKDQALLVNSFIEELGEQA